MSEEKGDYITDASKMLGAGYAKRPEGFQSPNYTQVPNDLFDILMQYMDGAELKVVLAIVRQTIGYHREATKFSIKKLSEMTGLCHNSVSAGADAAEKRGLIRRTNPDAQGSAEWEVVIFEPPSKTEGVDVKGGQKLRGIPSVNEVQVGLNKDKEIRIKENALSPNEIAEANKKVDYILENERRAKESWNGRGQMPEPIRELLDVYVEVTGQKPIKAKLIDWLQSGQEWLELGATAQDIREAHKIARPENGNGFMVSRPGSLTNTIGMIVGERHKTTEAKPHGYTPAPPPIRNNDYFTIDLDKLAPLEKRS
jgi:phage replication O-like protein O